jgi:predicted AlkP superfamily phosphohydrolase/phosphomutase
MIVLLGLDGLSIRHLSSTMERRELPSFRKVIAQGTYSKLRSTLPYVTGPAWASLFSGVNPGKHGIFDMYRVTPNGIQPSNYNTSDVPFLWDYVSWAKKKVLVLGVPFIYPAPEVCGTFVSGRFAPKFSCYPAGIESKFDLSSYDYNSSPISDSLKGAMNRSAEDVAIAFKSGLAKFAFYMLSAFERREQAALQLLDSESYELVILVDSLPDEVFHFCYGMQEIIDDMMVEFDSFLGKILERLGPEDSLFIVSDHGFASINQVLYINEWLVSHGYSSVTNSRLMQLLNAMGFNWDWLRSGSILSRLVSVSARLNILERLLTQGNLGGALVKDNSASKARAININESVAWVRLASATDAAIDRLVEELGELKDSGMLRTVAKSSAVFTGKHVPDAPGQIIIESKHYSVIDSVRTNNGRFSSRPPFWKRGAHERDGILLYRGPVPIAAESVSSIYDIVPTVLDMMHLPIPEFIDGISLAVSDRKSWKLRVPGDKTK